MIEPAAAVRSYPDRILYDGKIVTVDEAFSIVEAVATRDGQFLAVGETETIRSLAGPETDEMDLEGRTVLPGLVDSHIHLRQVGVDLDRVPLFEATSIEDVLTAIGDEASTTPDGE
jgi:predicted amidohydrolase YtcJ